MFRLPFRLVSIIGLTTSIACASLPPRGFEPAPAGAVAASPAVSPAVHPTLESAVEAAFAAAQQTGGRPDAHARLRLGTIRRAGEGYVWSAAVVSRENVWSRAPMRIRLTVDPEDVAVYVVHPRSGRPEVDHANESPSRSERAMVEALGRPLFLLTPSRRMVEVGVEVAVEAEPPERVLVGRDDRANQP